MAITTVGYRGRVLVAHNLAASTLWHRCIVFYPPKDTICEIQRKLFSFLGHLMDKLGWKSVKIVKEVTGLRSQRLASKLEIPLPIQDIYGESIARGQLLNQSDRQEFLRICVSPLMCDDNEGEVADSVLKLCFKKGFKMARFVCMISL